MTDVVTAPTDAAPARGAATAGAAVQDIQAELFVLLTRVRRRSREAARRIHPELGAIGYGVLLRVYREEPLRAADLVAGLDLDKGLVSRSVSQLERLDLVARTTDPADARAQRISLTAAGRRAVEDSIEAGRTDLQRSLASWSAEEVARFAEQLHRYNETLGS